MIVLGTRVVAEMTGRTRSAKVETWLDEQSGDALFLTSVTVAEMSAAIETLPDDRRRKALAGALDSTVDLFAGRILPFDEKAARTYGRLAAKWLQTGREIPASDRYIAAIAACNGFMFATHDAAPFLAVGLAVVEPWSFGG